MSIKQVYDTSAIVSLSLIDMLDLPDLLNISFFIPSAVMEELQDIQIITFLKKIFINLYYAKP